MFSQVSKTGVTNIHIVECFVKQAPGERCRAILMALLSFHNSELWYLIVGGLILHKRRVNKLQLHFCTDFAGRLMRNFEKNCNGSLLQTLLCKIIPVLAFRRNGLWGFCLNSGISSFKRQKFSLRLCHFNYGRNGDFQPILIHIGSRVVQNPIWIQDA